MSGNGTRCQRWPGAHVEGVQWIQEDYEAVSKHLRARESRPGEVRQTGQGGGVGPYEEGGQPADKTEVGIHDKFLDKQGQYSLQAP